MSEKEVLWRRCCDMESAENYAEAFKCALYLQRLDPKNEEIVDTLRRLNMLIQKRAEEANSTESRVKSTLNFLKNDGHDSSSLEKQVQAANNLVALVREEAGRKLFLEQKGFEVLMALMKNLKGKLEVRLALVRVMSQLAEADLALSLLIYRQVGPGFLVELMAESKDDQLLIAGQTLLQILITQFTSFNPKGSAKIDKEKLKKHQNEVDGIMTSLVEKINARTMSAKCRDSLLELLMVNMDYTALDWGKKLIAIEGLDRLLDVASELLEIRYESSIPITPDTRTHVSLVLEKVYLCMDYDKAREEYHEKVMTFMRHHLRGADIESKVRATAAITALLNGPLDAGNYCLGQAGIIEMMLAMANSEDLVQQCVAAEAIIAGASKKDKGQSMANLGTGILKTLYNSDNPKIKVRALVGLCKLGSVGGTDASLKTFSEESTLKLLKSCCQLLLEAPVCSGGEDVRKWAADGLAYLSLDADMKEALVDDLKSLNALIELGKTGDLSVLFGVVTTFVNLTNSYDKQELIPELVQLAKFSKQHVPEEHELDAKEYVDTRCKILAENHVTSALVALSRSKAKTSREMICRVFNAICEHKDLRGLVVQEGGAKVLIHLALDNNTDLGKHLAAQSLARIAITNNPELVFPGQRCVEVVKPIMELLHPDCSGLQNFEALMALTNLAQVSVAVRNRIIKDSGFARIEQYIYENHDMIKRAATQCIVNLILSDEVVKLFEGENDRVKYFMILTTEEDMETVSAAAGALAMLTSISKKACSKVFTSKEWLQQLIQLTSSQNPDLQHRGVVILHNLIAVGGECAAKIVESPLLELLMAIVRPEVDDIGPQIKQVAQAALNLAEEQKLIKNIEKL